MLRELNQERGHGCGKASASGMSLPSVRFWEGAVGDPEKHISYCLQAAPAHFHVQNFLQQIPAEGCPKAQSDQGASVSQQCS